MSTDLSYRIYPRQFFWAIMFLVFACQQWIPHHHEAEVSHEHITADAADVHHHHDLHATDHVHVQTLAREHALIAVNEVADCVAHCHVHVHNGTADCGAGIVHLSYSKKWQGSFALASLNEPAYGQWYSVQTIKGYSIHPFSLSGSYPPGKNGKRGPPLFS